MNNSSVMAPKSSSSKAQSSDTLTNETQTKADAETISVLFVCLGNICRSPMAEAVFSHLTGALGPSYPAIKTDSAGTGAYHTGSPPDSRTMATLQSHGITKYRHAARQVRGSDFDKFDYVLAMDGMNLRDLKRKARQVGGSEAEDRVSLFGSWDETESGDDIEDPYYGGDDGFETAYHQCIQFSKGWLRTVLELDAVVDGSGKVTVKKIEN